MPTPEQVLEAVAEVEDPEMSMGIVDLGLVYDVRLEDRDEGVHCEIDLTLTSPGCPVAPEIMAAVHAAALDVADLASVHVNLVWTPRWDPRIHASEEARMELNLW